MIKRRLTKNVFDVVSRTSSICAQSARLTKRAAPLINLSIAQHLTNAQQLVNRAPHLASCATYI